MSSEQVIAEMRDFAKGATIMDVMDAPAIVAKWADRLSTPANMVTVPASELRAMREEIERLRAIAEAVERAPLATVQSQTIWPQGLANGQRVRLLAIGEDG